MRKPFLLSAAFVLYCASGRQGLASPNVCEQQVGPINKSAMAYAMYSDSKFKDAAQCAAKVVNGKVVVDPAVTNPALSCPDLFSWKLFIDALKDQFWVNWAADQQTWPGCAAGGPGCAPPHQPTMPLPLCAQGSDPGKCCNPTSNNNPGSKDGWNPAMYCPYFPGDHKGAAAAQLGPIGLPPTKAHVNNFAVATGLSETKLLEADPSRKIRQTMSEIVFRNKSMWSYVFQNNLYNQEGLAAVLSSANANLSGNLPYRDRDATARLNEIDFPVQSVMIKSDWLNEKAALAMGLRDEPPHIKMDIRSPVTDNNGTILEKGPHWLVAMHISSKDTPNWVWTTFEHVANPGRCDYTGCNDSFGYLSADPAIGPKQQRNFTAPKMKCDDLPLAAWVFDTEKQYADGSITPALNALFTAAGIGQGKASPSPSPGDPRWRNYRLKGSQVEFTDATGQFTRLGNSVTEAGFINSSSCITCHARASIGAQGTIPLPNGVFINQLGEQGYAESAHGLPNPAWFQASAQPPAYRALPADFVWGVLTALCVDPKFNPAVCSLGAPAAALGAPRGTVAPPRTLREVIQH